MPARGATQLALLLGLAPAFPPHDAARTDLPGAQRAGPQDSASGCNPKRSAGTWRRDGCGSRHHSLSGLHAKRRTPPPNASLVAVPSAVQGAQVLPRVRRELASDDTGFRTSFLCGRNCLVSCGPPLWLGCLSCLPCLGCLLVHHQAWQSSRQGLHGSSAVPGSCFVTFVCVVCMRVNFVILMVGADICLIGK